MTGGLQKVESDALESALDFTESDGAFEGECVGEEWEVCVGAHVFAESAYFLVVLEFLDGARGEIVAVGASHEIHDDVVRELEEVGARRVVGEARGRSEEFFRRGVVGEISASELVDFEALRGSAVGAFFELECA